MIRLIAVPGLSTTTLLVSAPRDEVLSTEVGNRPLRKRIAAVLAKVRNAPAVLDVDVSRKSNTADDGMA